MSGTRMRDPFVIRKLEFLGGMATAGGWRPEPRLPEVAFAGRSNVGKSSLLNVLVKRRKLARVSNTPGRTRQINFFAVNDALMLVDLPGYGYARVSHTERAAWRPLVESYLRESPELRGVVQLVDARRDPTPEDLQMLDFLAELGAPTLVALTKMDKLVARAREGRAGELARQIGVAAEQVIPFSSVTGAGRDELAEAILELVGSPAWRTPR